MFNFRKYMEAKDRWTWYPGLELVVQKTGKCLCGKTRQRRKSFKQITKCIPKNRPKAFAAIKRSLAHKANLWKQEPIYCKNCIKILIERNSNV